MKYSSLEEKWNIRTHAFGLIASIAGLILLVYLSKDAIEVVASLVFGLSLCILYLASTLYHASTEDKVRRRLRIFDHAAIYLLIAGTYTPVCLLPLWESSGTTLLFVIWGIAGVGVILKLFFTGRFDRLSTIMYVAMGWVAVFAIRSILRDIETSGLVWLLGGGIFYTVGAVIYAFRKIPFNHAIFHVFVLGGSACHFKMVLNLITS